MIIMLIYDNIYDNNVILPTPTPTPTWVYPYECRSGFNTHAYHSESGFNTHYSIHGVGLIHTCTWVCLAVEPQGGGGDEVVVEGRRGCSVLHACGS
jgi:hypothetical protein